MLKFLVVDVDEVGPQTTNIVEDADSIPVAVELATNFADETMENDSDGVNTINVGIYKLVKTVTVSRKRTVNVKSHK